MCFDEDPRSEGPGEIVALFRQVKPGLTNSALAVEPHVRSGQAVAHFDPRAGQAGNVLITPEDKREAHVTLRAEEGPFTANLAQRVLLQYYKVRGSSRQQEIERHVEDLSREASLARDEVGCHALSIADVLVGHKPSRVGHIVQVSPRVHVPSPIVLIEPTTSKAPPSLHLGTSGFATEGVRHLSARSQQHQHDVLAPSVRRDAQPRAVLVSRIRISAGGKKLYDHVRAAHPRSKVINSFQSHQMHGPIERRPSEVGHIYVGAAAEGGAEPDEIPRVYRGK